jgi:hypothetical protein
MEHFFSTSDGLLMVANGIDPVLVWDGNDQEMEPAGVPAPTTALTLAASETGKINGTYYAYTRFVDERNNPSDLSPISDAGLFSDVGLVQYTNVPVPTSAKVKRRQILRNTAGQTDVFYVDIDTDDLTTTSFISVREDYDLQVQEAVALFDEQDNILANTHGLPPSDKAFLASNLDRMFLAGEETYRDGSVKTVFGSKTVTGIGTEWPATFAGRFLWVAGADRSYEIESVNVTAQTLTLVDAYETTSLPYSSYGIRPPDDQRRLVQFSRAGEPESWLASDAVTVQEDGDDITGLMAMGSFLYIILKRHCYRLTFQEDPIKDGLIFLACNRGCVNNRSWVVVDEACYMLDEAGIYQFKGSRQTEVVSSPIQDLFEPARGERRYRIRFEASRYFHAVYDYGQQVIRWFVSLGSTRYPRHALCFNIVSRAWWIEEFPVPIASSCEGVLDGQRRVFLGGPGGEVYTLGASTLDVVDPIRGTVRGAVTSSKPRALTDDNANFGDDVVGCPIVVVDGEGRGQLRKIVERVSATEVRIDRPWNVTPTSPDVYQVGGIKWRYRTGWFRWGVLTPEETNRRLEILFEPCVYEQRLDVQLYQDRSQTPTVWDADYSPDELSMLGSERESPLLHGDMTGNRGFMQRRLDDHRDVYIDGRRIFSWELDGVTNRDDAIIYQLTLDGAIGNER